jgi:diguanylate cyclase (GGDEF)-like protein
MKQAPIPMDDDARLAALTSLDILYTPAEERFDRITSLAKTIFSVPIVLVSLVARDVQWFKSAQGLTAPETPRDISFCGHAILRQSALIIPDALDNPDFADNPLVTGEPFVRFYAGHPLRAAGYNIGTLCLIDHEPREFSEEDAKTLASLAKWAENELKIDSLNSSHDDLLKELDQAKRASLIDPLTTVWNRRGLEQMVNVEINRARRKASESTVMLVDLDDFKLVNDTHGHMAGDTVLKEVAQMLIATIRPQDVTCRYGGDEFLLLLGDCSRETASAIADRILDRAQRRAHSISDDTSIKVGLSIGASTAKITDEDTFSSVLALADKAVYLAKDAGRGCAHFL